MKGYKTLAVNGALAVLPLVDFVVNNGAIVGAVVGANAPALLSFIGLVNIVLRWVTTTPMFKSE